MPIQYLCGASGFDGWRWATLSCQRFSRRKALGTSRRSSGPVQLGRLGFESSLLSGFGGLVRWGRGWRACAAGLGAASRVFALAGGGGLFEDAEVCCGVFFGSALFADVDGLGGFGCGVVVRCEGLTLFDFRFGRCGVDLVAALAFDVRLLVEVRGDVGVFVIAAHCNNVRWLEGEILHWCVVFELMLWSIHEFAVFFLDGCLVAVEFSHG
jgi:hypothetical protein